MIKEDKYQQWKHAVCKNDESNKKMMLTLKESENLILDITSRLNNDNGRTLITYNELKNVEFNKWIDVNKGVRIKRVYHPSKPVFFVTEMIPYKTKIGIAEFGLQEHDCKEICVIKKGHLIETLERNKYYTKGEYVIYPMFYMHKPSAKEHSIYEVEFIPNLENVTSSRT